MSLVVIAPLTGCPVLAVHVRNSHIMSDNGAGAEGARGGLGSARPRRLSRPQHRVDAGEHPAALQEPRGLGPLGAIRTREGDGDDAIRVSSRRGVSRRSRATRGLGAGVWSVGAGAVRSRRYCCYASGMKVAVLPQRQRHEVPQRTQNTSNPHGNRMVTVTTQLPCSHDGADRDACLDH